MKSIYKADEQVYTMPCWDDSPFKCYQRFIPTNDNRFSNSFKLKFSPYKTPKRTIKSFIPRSDSVALDVEPATKIHPNEFPRRRNLSISQNLRPKMSRSRSIAVDRISLLEIENIERLQQLIPAKPVNLNYNFKPQLKKNTFLITTRPAQRTYRRFTKTRR